MMKTCSIFCYYEGYNTKGDILCNGNHACDVEYSHNVAAGDYIKNTCEHLMSELKPQYASLSRVVLKSVTIFPHE